MGEAISILLVITSKWVRRKLPPRRRATFLMNLEMKMSKSLKHTHDEAHRERLHAARRKEAAREWDPRRIDAEIAEYLLERIQGSGIRNQGSGFRDQESGIRDQMERT
jgi:hypothetical protein